MQKIKKQAEQEKSYLKEFFERKLNFVLGLISIIIVILLKLLQLISDWREEGFLNVYEGPASQIIFYSLLEVFMIIITLLSWHYHTILKDREDAFYVEKAIRRPKSLRDLLTNAKREIDEIMGALAEKADQAVEFITAMNTTDTDKKIDINVPPVELDKELERDKLLKELKELRELKLKDN